MLTNLNWLAEGASWPPPSEKPRIERYKKHARLFASEHPEVWKEAFRALADKYKKKNWNVETILNYHQLLSKKTADFVCGAAPNIETEGDTDALTKLMNKQNFFGKLYEGIIDVSRYGNGLVKFVGTEIRQANPQYWIPIVDPSDQKRIMMDVIAYPTETNAEGVPTQLYAEIHTPGSIEIRKYKYNAKDETIGPLIEAREPASTGLDISAVQPLTNLTTSDSVFGVDDYNIVNSIISKVMWRLHCGDTVLDKHSEPSMTGPESALEYDERTKLWYVPLGNYFKRVSNDEPPFGYVTWDGNMESSFKELEFLMDQLYILSEMGQAFADAGGNSGDSSGTALKLRMVSPRIKAQRLVNLNDPRVKQIIYTLAKLNGISIDYDTLTVHWSDGLPVDEKDQIETLAQATGGKAIMSQYTALKKRGLTDEEAEKELEQIRNEETYLAPITDVLRPNGEDEDTGVGDDE